MKTVIIIFVLLISGGRASAANLQTFLKHCAYGTLVGAGVGVISLAFNDKPSDNTGNVAKGASLGLYGGVAYGVYKLNEVPLPLNTIVDPYALFLPIIENGKLDGGSVLVHLANF